jgi:hypothetical protein
MGSIIATLGSLFLGVMSSYLKLDVTAADHMYMLNSYQYIAQRAREVKWPDMPYEEVIALLRDLERDFQLLKARGREPEDRHFDVAHELVDKIRRNPETRSARSFEVGSENRNIVEAKALGGPSAPLRSEGASEQLPGERADF